MLLLQSLSQRFRPAVVRAHNRIGKKYSSSSGEYSFNHEFVPRFAASVAATSLTVVVFAFTISRYQASVKHKMVLNAIEETNFQQAAVRVDVALGKIVANQTRHVIMMNNLAIHCCNAPLGELLKSQETYRKLVPILGCKSLKWIDIPLSEEANAELTAIDEIFSNYHAILVEWNRLEDYQKARYLRGIASKFEEFAVLSISPTTLCMLAVVVPTKIAAKQNMGIYVPSQQIIDVAILFSTYLSAHFVSSYVPNEEDLKFVIKEIENTIKNQKK
jgi:hypothetical protein